MRPLSFRLRLALFFVATLVAVQVLTGFLVYEVTRRALIAEGEQQLAATASAFVAQMDDISARVADNVQILSLDFALRSAIAERDQGTVLSVLRNHGRRVGASRMLLLNLDGTVAADTDKTAHPMQRFPFPGMIRAAYDSRAAAVVMLNGKAHWMVVVPIYAPQPVALVVVSIPVDDALLAHMQHLSALPKDIELAARDKEGRWSVVARGDAHSMLTSGFLRGQKVLPLAPVLTRIGGEETIVQAQPLQQPAASAPVVAMLGYSLDDALRPFRFMALAGATLLLFGLVLGLLAAWLTARSVARPIEHLATSARRIEAGDYRAQSMPERHDEIGELATAFATMTAAVREREQRIRHQAQHDAVTDLPNRQAAEATIDADLARAGHAGGALLMVALIRAPEIVKTMGHALCDRLMRHVGESLCAIAGNRLVARATDSQFVVWLPNTAKADATAVAVKILQTLGDPYREPNVAIDMQPAIGIALAPADGQQASILLRHVEVAQFASNGSSAAVRYYDAASDPHRPEQLSLMSELREAIDADQLALHYQPKLALASRCIDSAEALIRWPHRQRGMITPDTFIGMAEDTGNIQRLTSWVMAHVLAQMGQWIEQGYPLIVAANLSARDLDDAQLPARVQQLLQIHGVPPQQLTLEVTERAVIHEPQRAIRILHELAEQGIGIAIDDFGAGQASLAYLRHLPVSEIKIDQMFVRQLATDENDRIIVRAIVELGHRLGYQVTAEGVEDQAALDYLADVGCDHAQGYFIAKPQPVDGFHAVLEQNRTGVAS